MRPVITRILLLFFVINVGACSYLTGPDGIFRDRKNDYRKAKAIPRMTIVDGLDDSAIVDLYPVPPISPYSDGELIDSFILPAGVIDARKPVTLQTLGDSQWLLLQASPSQVWPRLKEFISGQNMSISIENGTAGMIEATASEGGVYRFRIRQGFQRNMAELSIRFLSNPAEVSSFWPEKSSNQDKEAAMLGSISDFFMKVSDKPAYSFAAQGISTQKTLTVEHDVDGGKFLVLNTNVARALMSVEQSLKQAGFTIEKADEAGQSFYAQYTPPSQNKKPGFFARMFQLKPDRYDKDAKFAGNHYKFVVSDDGDHARVTVQALDMEKDKKDKKDAEFIRREQNYILLLLKEHLF